MKLPFESYNPAWILEFENWKDRLSTLLDSLAPDIDHIGSTSIEGLSAKPIIDIQIGVKDKTDLDKVAQLMILPNIVYYEKYNEDMPTRRFFVIFSKTTEDLGVRPIVEKGEGIPSVLHNHDLRLAHIHVFVKGSKDWVRHLAFRDYLRMHAQIAQDYQRLKEELVKQNWEDGNQYNEGKDEFLKKHEALALDWYENRYQRSLM